MRKNSFTLSLGADVAVETKTFLDRCRQPRGAPKSSL
jgi:hypothetical protein